MSKLCPFRHAIPRDGLVLWLRADAVSGVAENGAMSAWSDLSGSGNHVTQTTPANQPLWSSGPNGTPEVAFDYVDMTGTKARYFDTPSISLPKQSYTFITCGRLVSKHLTRNYAVTIDCGAEPKFGYSPLGAACYSDSAHDTTARMFHQTDVVGCMSSASAFKVWAGATSRSWDAVANGTITVSTVGTSSLTFHGALNEVLVYDRPLSDAEYLQICTALRSRWRFAGSPTKQVVFDGDSLTTGYNCQNNRNMPTQLWWMLGSDWRIYCVPVAGQTTAEMTADAATEVDVLYSESLAKNVLVDWSGVMDIYYDQTAEQTEARIAAYCGARQTAGWKVVVCTILPSGFADNTVRKAANTLIRANWATYADALADLDDSVLGGDTGNTNATYYDNSDNNTTHLNPTGFAVIASIIKTAIDGI